jgi:hypothetical protein
MDVVIPYIIIDENHVKNGTTGFKIFTAFRNDAANLPLHSLHRSGEINNNLLKLLLSLYLQAIRCRSAATLETVTK